MIKYSTRRELEALKKEIMLNDRQSKIFKLKYEDGKSIAYIADTLGFSSRTIDIELQVIRRKIQKLL